MNEDFIKYLPTGDMLADFEKFKAMNPEERVIFQEARAQKVEAMSDDERHTFTDATKKGLSAIKSDLQDMKLA